MQFFTPVFYSGFLYSVTLTLRIYCNTTLFNGGWAGTACPISGAKHGSFAYI
jgi:hypothetical protein